MFVSLIALVVSGVSHAQSPRFIWDAGGTISTSYSIGDLADRSLVAPADLGPDNLLTRADLEATGTEYTVQGVLVSELDARVRLGWITELVDLEIRGSLLARLSPQGFPQQSGTAVAPGESGIRIERRPQRWGDARISVEIGRLRLGESTGRVVDQLVDGAGVAARFPDAYIALGGGVTAFVNPYFFTPRLLPADTVDGSSWSAPQRLIAVARVEVARVAGHDLGGFAVYYDDRMPSTGDDSYFAGITARGTIVSGWGALARLDHTSTLVAQWRSSSPRVAFLAAGTLRARGTLALVAELDASYASGAGGGLDEFMPVTPTPVGRVLALPQSDLLTIALEAGFERGERFPLVPAARGALFVSATGANPFFATELTAHLGYGILPDARIRADAGAAWSPLGWSPIFRVEGRVAL
ncbi:MAG: hypothetical protein ACOC1U_10160 [Spirochaetota bacterium]